MAAIDSYVILLIGYAVLALLKKVGERGKGAPSRPVPQGRRQPATMDELLREMQGQLEVEESDPEDRMAIDEYEPIRLPVPQTQPAWDVEERESLEVAARIDVRPEVVRAARVQVDRDDNAEAVAEHRIELAEARNRAWNPEDHRKFDARIRAVVPVRKVDSSRSQALRQAMIWREVLDKPVALRDGS
jgi:hypothetical protein